MKRINNKKNLYKSIILLVIVVIGIGYAYLTSNLSIAGSTEIAGNTWDIHFDNLQVTSGSVTASSPATIDSNEVDITYAISLARPKDFYEFTVDVVNEGTLPGKVSISELSGLDTTSSKVVDYTIAYTNGNPVNVGDILNAGATKTIKVRVFYKDNISSTDLPSSNLNLDLTYTLQYVQSEEDEAITFTTPIQNLIDNQETCFTKYEGQVTDQPGQTVTASNVYFNKCADKRNIKFGGYCWQMIRTTETGGIKMLYNGEPDNNGECGTSRDNHKGIVQTNGYASILTIDSNYLYGSSFTYDTTNNSFTLTNTETVTWSDSTYENLIGKYTCLTTNDTCTTLYQVNGYKSNTDAYLPYYTITNTNYYQIGKSSYNAYYYSPAMVGYMFNKASSYQYKSPGSSTYKFGSTFTYSNGTYTLSGTTQDITNWSSGYASLNNTHYTCWNADGTCTTISYVIYTTSSSANYFDITGGKSVSDLLVDMLSSNDVNRYNSSIKGVIDAWYKQNLLSKTNMLEDTVYCNARNIISYGGWNPEGGSTRSNYYLKFKNYNDTTNLACPNETDQFSVGNNKAKLTYPVGLLESEERYNINTSSLLETGGYWWTISPNMFYYSDSSARNVSTGGGGASDLLGDTNGVRPVISLKSGVVISEGTGSETDPWIID